MTRLAAVAACCAALACSADTAKSPAPTAEQNAEPVGPQTPQTPSSKSTPVPTPAAPDAAAPVSGPIIGTFTADRPALRGPMPNGGLRSFQKTVARQVQSNKDHYLVERITDEKVIALTFDDGPDPKMTPRLLKALADGGAKATFFLVGHRVEAYPHLVDKIKQAGHTVAGHGYRHIDHRKLDAAAAATKVFSNDDVIAKAFGNHAGYWRPPYGAVTDEQLDLLRARDFRTVLWSVDSLDWSPKYATAELIERRVLAQAHPGAIVLLHSGGRRTATAAALPRILEELSRRGYRFDTIEGMFSLPRAAKPDGK